MKNTSLLLILILFAGFQISGQTDPRITSWLLNTSETGSYYVNGNSNTIDNNILYNCQLVEYSDDYVYVHTKGIPAYPTGPFLDANPSQASDQDAIYKMPRYPVVASNPENTNGGNIGIFINGVSLI